MHMIKKVLTIIGLLALTVQIVCAPAFAKVPADTTTTEAVQEAADTTDNKDKSVEEDPVAAPEDPVAAPEDPVTAPVGPAKEMTENWDIETAVFSVDNSQVDYDLENKKLSFQFSKGTVHTLHFPDVELHDSIADSPEGRRLFYATKPTALGALFKKGSLSGAYQSTHMITNPSLAKCKSASGPATSCAYNIKTFESHAPFESSDSYKQYQYQPVQDTTVVTDSATHITGRFLKVDRFGGTHYPVFGSYSCNALLEDKDGIAHELQTLKDKVCNYLYDAIRADMPVTVQYVAGNDIVTIRPAHTDISEQAIGLDKKPVTESVKSEPFTPSEESSLLGSAVNTVVGVFVGTASVGDEAESTKSAETEKTSKTEEPAKTEEPVKTEEAVKAEESVTTEETAKTEESEKAESTPSDAADSGIASFMWNLVFGSAETATQKSTAAEEKESDKAETQTTQKDAATEDKESDDAATEDKKSDKVETQAAQKDAVTEDTKSDKNKKSEAPKPPVQSVKVDEKSTEQSSVNPTKTADKSTTQPPVQRTATQKPLTSTVTVTVTPTPVQSVKVDEKSTEQSSANPTKTADKSTTQQPSPTPPSKLKPPRRVNR